MIAGERKTHLLRACFGNTFSILRPNAEARTKQARLMIAGERKTHLLRACFGSTPENQRGKQCQAFICADPRQSVANYAGYSPRNAFNAAASKT